MFSIKKIDATNFNLNVFKNIINEKIKLLSNNKIDFSVDNEGDEGDEVQANIILDLAYTYNDRNKESIENLMCALKKINEGEYGICEECGEDIGLRRLEVCPEAKYCIRCAEQIEKETKGTIYWKK